LNDEIGSSRQRQRNARPRLQSSAAATRKGPRICNVPLDYRLYLIDNSTTIGTIDASLVKSITLAEGAMCSFVLSVLDVQKLNPNDRNDVEKELRRRKTSIESQLTELQEQLTSVDTALSTFNTKNVR
jgi:hypothetical protein